MTDLSIFAGYPDHYDELCNAIVNIIEDYYKDLPTEVTDENYKLFLKTINVEDINHKINERISNKQFSHDFIWRYVTHYSNLKLNNKMLDIILRSIGGYGIHSKGEYIYNKPVISFYTIKSTNYDNHNKAQKINKMKVKEINYEKMFSMIDKIIRDKITLQIHYTEMSPAIILDEVELNAHQLQKVINYALRRYEFGEHVFLLDYEKSRGVKIKVIDRTSDNICFNYAYSIEIDKPSMSEIKADKAWIILDPPKKPNLWQKIKQCFKDD